MSDRLANKVTLVTGGASQPSLGNAIGQRFAEEGAIVYLTDVDETGLKKSAADIEKSIGNGAGKIITLAQDVTSEEDWDRVFAQIKSDHGRLDVIVNNAGVFIPGVMGEQGGDEFRRQIDINLNSVFYGMTRAIELMKEVGEGGSIINMSSVCGLVGVPGTGAYAATKGGLRIMGKVAAVEHAEANIRVNSIHPGLINTNIQLVAAKNNPNYYDEVSAGVPMKRFGEPVDVANLALFLASDESSYITGVEMTIDGGMTAK